MITIGATVTTPDFAEAMNALGAPVRFQVRQVLQAIGASTVDFLKSYTSVMRPPLRVADAMRAAHPGGWADVTGVLANSYGWAVTEGADGWILKLFNDADYAVYLETKEGYFVLHGVTDPGGPVEEALRRAVALVAPTWKIQYIGFTAG